MSNGNVNALPLDGRVADPLRPHACRDILNSMGVREKVVDEMTKPHSAVAIST